MTVGVQVIVIFFLVSCQLGLVYSECKDIDTQACQLMSSQRPDLCTDPTLSTTACPQYCHLCPLMCYHCDTTVSDFHMCNSTKACAKGEVCMRKQLQSSKDGHIEYELTCATKQACDGLGLAISFGKRNVHSRDVTVSCCDSNQCNYPYEDKTSTPSPTTTTTTTMPTTTTTVSKCKKDVLILVDETNSLFHYTTDITDFLNNVLRQMNIGNDGVLTSLATFGEQATKRWDYDTYTSAFTLRIAVSGLALKGLPSGDLNSAILYALSNVNSGNNGNRADAPDVVLIITDDGAKGAYLEQIYERKLHTLTDNVIAIGIGNQVSDAEIQHLATDSHHDFTVPRPQALSTLDTQVANLICGN